MSTTIFEALRADHDIQRAMADELLATTGASDERRDGFTQLVTELKAHATSEERHFYVPLMQDDLTQEKARHSVAEHHEMDELIEKLEGYDLGASQWLVTYRELHHMVHHHLDEEEQEIFQVAGKALSASAKTSLAVDYEREMHRQRAEFA
jgi:hemerythrin-like domain-containing protein